MEPQQKENRILQELALIYIALAHGADGDLSDEEIDKIGDRLAAWQIEAPQTVTSALKEALDAYVSDGMDGRLEHAATVVRERFSEERRRDLLDDLMEIAMADGRFLFRESSFIERMARLLDVHVQDSEGSVGASWSLLTGSESEPWTPVHDLALIYVTLAHRSDDDLSTEEISAIASKLNEWVPDAPEDAVLGVVQDVLSVYVQGHDKRIFLDAVESVRQRVPEHQIPALLADLEYVARADGRVLDEEKQIIAQLRQVLAVSPVAG